MLWFRTIANSAIVNLSQIVLHDPFPSSKSLLNRQSNTSFNFSRDLSNFSCVC